MPQKVVHRTRLTNTLYASAQGEHRESAQLDQGPRQHHAGNMRNGQYTQRGLDRTREAKVFVCGVRRHARFRRRRERWGLRSRHLQQESRGVHVLTAAATAATSSSFIIATSTSASAAESFLFDCFFSTATVAAFEKRYGFYAHDAIFDG